MNARTKQLLVVSAAVGIGASVFLIPAATSNPFQGPFAGSSDAPSTPEEVGALLVGTDQSMRTLTLVGDGTYTADVLTIHSGQIRMVPTTVTATGYIRWNDSIEGFDFGKTLINCAGCSARLDVIEPRQTDVPVRIDGAHGLRLAPQSSADACTSGLKGQSTTLSSDGRTYYCDGATLQRVGFTLSNSASLDFPSMNNNEDATLTMTVTGAASGDAVTCNPTTALETGLQVSYSYVSAADTVTVVLHDASGGTVDPAAATYRCTITR